MKNHRFFTVYLSSIPGEFGICRGIIMENMSMEKIVMQALLYDFYGELLNDHQKAVYEDYVYNDIGISEIAEERGISRQGVHDLIKRCSKILQDYENKLHLVEKFQRTKELVARINSLTEQFGRNNDLRLIDEIKQISGHILDDTF